MLHEVRAHHRTSPGSALARLRATRKVGVGVDAEVALGLPRVCVHHARLAPQIARYSGKRGHVALLGGRHAAAQLL
eukprot:1889751-Lingulodinium_polyedra.AAC.1